ncbi:MAG: hypothetical protein CME31_01140 [Gimesia sp.]|nr:hypothetical protein [Gimesia sp.]|tara:strand:+ start:13320 stop:13940 length:621 start_codon:yes stop_codon:yes gene_type:complete
MKPNIIIAAVLIFFLTSAMQADFPAQQGKDTQETVLPAPQQNSSAVKKDLVFEYPSAGLTIGLHENRTALRILGDGTMISPPFYQTSRINRALFEWVSTQKQLKKITLEMVVFDDNDLSQLQKLPELEQFSLNGTSLGDQGVGHISKMNSISGIAINYGLITDHSIPYLLQMKKLTYLTINRSRFFPLNGATTLQQGLPETQVQIY